MWEREGASANNLQILLPKPLFLRPSPRSHSRCVYANVCKTGYNFMLCGHYPSPSPVPLPLPPSCTGYVNSHQAQQVRAHRPKGSRIGKGRDHRNDHLSPVLALRSPFPMTHTHTRTRTVVAMTITKVVVVSPVFKAVRSLRLCLFLVRFSLPPVFLPTPFLALTLSLSLPRV